MRALDRDVQLVGTVASVDGVRNEEVGRTILLCRDPLVPLNDAWARRRDLS
jgi:hypothetical protein